MRPRTTVSIDYQALAHNVTRVKYYAPHSKIIAMLKANAYGHGLVPVARAIEDQVDRIGLACLDEAKRLRDAGITTKILLMQGCASKADWLQAITLDCEAVVYDAEQVTVLQSLPEGSNIYVWLKCDTGMHRIGVLPESLVSVHQALLACPVVNKRISFMSHFANADADADNGPSVEEQFAIAQQLDTSGFVNTSFANSAAILAHPSTHGDFVRPGLMIYGVAPFEGKRSDEYGLKASMRFSSRLMAVRHLRRGDAIGYGSAWVCPEDMVVGVVSVGYGDGYPRHAANGTPVWLNGQRAPIVGRVSMDMLTIDLRDQPDAKVDDEVVLWGPELCVSEIAQRCETIPYELLCNARQR